MSAPQRLALESSKCGGNDALVELRASELGGRAQASVEKAAMGDWGRLDGLGLCEVLMGNADTSCKLSKRRKSCTEVDASDQPDAARLGWLPSADVGGL